MFAFVLWDRVAGKLILARDRFGIKPLYYTRVGDLFAFGSEMKALFEVPGCPRAVDWEAALSDQTLAAAPVFSQAPVCTWFQGIEMVPAATIVEIDLATGRQRWHRYWDLPYGKTEASDRDFVTAYRDLLAESTARCGTADAEIGLFLSGGIDSAAIAAFTPNRRDVHTFTALNGSTTANGDARHAHLVAAALGMPHHQVLMGPQAVPSPGEWRRLVWQLESPLAGPEPYYKYEMYRYVKQARPELRAMLLGQGADEFNGGYLIELAGGGGFADAEANLAEMARQSALDGRGAAFRQWWNGERAGLLTDDALSIVDDPYDLFVAWKYRDIQQYNTWHEDRTAAGNGVEARVPFLDHRLIELTASIPVRQRERLLWDKHIVREALRGLLPPEVVARPKVPFFYSGGERYAYRTFVAMLADGQLLDQALSTGAARRYLDPDGLRGALATLRRDPAAGGVEVLLRLVSLGLLESMVRDLPPAMVDSPRAAVAQGLVVPEWDATTMAALTMPVVEMDVSLTPALAGHVVLLVPPGRDDIGYLAVDGSLEYVADGDWLEFLSLVDGAASVRDILAKMGREVEAILEPLTDSVQLGLLEVTKVGVAA
jgi:asparagine synthase (glutamine-hydrolysing)